MNDAAVIRRARARRAFYRASEALWKRRHEYRQRKLKSWRRRQSYRFRKWQGYRHVKPKNDPLRKKWWALYAQARAEVSKWTQLRDEATKRRRQRLTQIAGCDRTITRHSRTLAQRAHAEAVRLIGVMEEGGNNAGPEVSRIIRENGGTGPEPWCGDFQAHNYRVAGSKVVCRRWAAVRLLRTIAGIVPTTLPVEGDLVTFTFDHVGMYERDNGDGTITTVEGNTGRVGAVSDSSTGGDGVYRKVRAKSLVAEYLHVTR